MFFLGFLVEHFLASQDVEIVLGEAVGLVPDVLQQLAGGRIGRQLQRLAAALQENLLLSFGD